jgi:hypothetical protein
MCATRTDAYRASCAITIVPAPVAPLGGTFDPIHSGYVRFADGVRRAYRLSDAFGSFPRGTRRIAGARQRRRPIALPCCGWR